jgi:hypothetical protein
MVEQRLQHRRESNASMTPPSRMTGRDIALVVGLAMVLRVWGLEDKNLWLDEAASWVTSRLRASELLASTAADIHPPLYYLMLKAWMSLAGDQLIGLRALSVLWGVAAVALGSLVARDVLARPLAITVAIWLAASPHMISYAQEARMYAALTATVLAAFIAYRAWVRSGYVRTAALVWYAVAAASSLYLHYFAAVLLTALWAHLAATAIAQRPAATRASVWRRWLAANLGVVLLYLPWLPVAIGHLERGQPWRTPVPVSQAPTEVIIAAQTLLQGYTWGVPGWMWLTGLALQCLVLAGLLGLAWKVARESWTGDAGLLAAIVVTSAALGGAILVAAGGMDLARYLSYVTPLLAMAAALGWQTVAGRRAWLAGALAVICSAPWLAAYYRAPSRDSDVRPIVAFLASPAAERGPILVAPGFMRICVDYEVRARGGLELMPIAVGDDLEAHLHRARASAEVIWLILDYRWPDGDRVARAAGFADAGVVGDRSGVRLYRAR